MTNSRNLASGGLMASPWAALTVAETTAAAGPAAVVAGAGAGVALGARQIIRRRRETTGATTSRGARRLLRSAAAAADRRAAARAGIGRVRRGLSRAPWKRSSSAGTGAPGSTRGRAGRQAGQSRRGMAGRGRNVSTAHGSPSPFGSKGRGGKGGTGGPSRRRTGGGMSPWQRRGMPGTARHATNRGHSWNKGRGGKGGGGRSRFGSGPRATKARNIQRGRGYIRKVCGGRGMPWRERRTPWSQGPGWTSDIPPAWGTARPSGGSGSTSGGTTGGRTHPSGEYGPRPTSGASQWGPIYATSVRVDEPSMWDRVRQVRRAIAAARAQAAWTQEATPPPRSRASRMASAPARKWAAWRTRSGMGALVKTLTIPVAAASAVAGAAIAGPRALARVTRATGSWVWCQAATARAGWTAYRSITSNTQPRVINAPSSSLAPTTGGIEMSYIPTHMKAVAEAIRNAGALERVDGVTVASWIADLHGALTALAEAVGSDTSTIRERLLQEDGGESLARIAQAVAVAAQLTGEYGAQWAQVHGERLTRQAEPVAGEEGWDVRAVQGR